MIDQKFDLNDIIIIPSVVSHINSRKECNPFYFYESGFLPLMTAPMDTVINEKNIQLFRSNKIIPCNTRGNISNTPSYTSFGLNEIEYQLKSEEKNKTDFYNFDYVLIDIANGHMQRLIDVVKEIKKSYPFITLIVGNVAHPLTYKNLAIAGADYVRVGIGGGSACITSANSAIHYPMGSLIKECYEEKIKGNLNAKIIADGGVKGYDDIIKLLALGANYVMIGSLFNKAIESAGDNYLWKIKIPYRLAKTLYKYKFPIYKKYRGMSTKEVQKKWGKSHLITSEGIIKYQKVEYSLSQWTENFKDYLKSCMSYCGIKHIEDFIGNVDWVYISNNALKRFQK